MLWCMASEAQTIQEQAFMQANHYYNESRYDSALVIYKSIIDEGYTSVPLLYNMGNTYFKLKDYPMAILNYEKALKIDPKRRGKRKPIHCQRSDNRQDRAAARLLPDKNMEQHQQPADGRRMGYHLINIICADNDVNIFLYNNKKDRRKEGDILHKHHFCCVIYLHLDNLVPEAHPIKFA